MKKILSIILLFVLLIPSVSSTESVVSSRTDQELKDMIALCSSELRSRHKNPDGWILIFEYSDIKVYQIDDAEIFLGSLLVPVAIVNDSNRDILLCTEDCLCNGWEIYSGSISAKMNTKKKETLSFELSESDAKSIDQIISLQFRWNLIDTTEKAVSIFEQDEREEHHFW